MPVVVIAEFDALPEGRDVVRAALQEALSQVHAEEGCQLYALHEKGDEFVLVEQWRDGQALEGHMDGAARGRLRSAVEGKLAGPVRVRIFTPVESDNPEQGRLRA